MDIAVLSDIHGNYEALKTCMQYALNKKINTFIFLGDYLGELAFPQRTMEYLYWLRDSYNCTFVRGNKEDYWLKYRRAGERGWKEKDSTTGSLYYAYYHLTDKDMEFFEQMEITDIVSFDKMETITVCHGSLRLVNEKLLSGKPNTYEVMEQSQTRLILCGHTHIQNKIDYNDKVVLNPGSVGVPLLSGGKAQFCILHEHNCRWKEEFISLEYDAEKEIENLYQAKLDEYAPYWCKTTVHLLRTGKYAHSQILDKAMSFCKEEKGECIWPDIPELYWKRAYESYFGKEEL